MNQRCPPMVQVDLAVNRLEAAKKSVQLFAWAGTRRSFPRCV
jgi:hypothetical protein